MNPTIAAPKDRLYPSPLTVPGSNTTADKKPSVPQSHLSSDDQDEKSCAHGRASPKLAHSENLEQPVTELEAGTATAVAATAEASTPFPEGGFGWLVVFGAFMIQFW